MVIYGLQESNNDLAKVRGLLLVCDCTDSMVRVSRLGKPIAGSDGANSKQKCPLKVELWSQGDREFVLQQAKTICDFTSGKLYVAKYFNAAQLTVINEVRSKCIDLNRNAALCSDGRARDVVINDKIRKRSNNGKLERFVDTSVSTNVASKSISDTSVKSANGNVTVITSESIVQAPDASKSALGGGH